MNLRILGTAFGNNLQNAKEKTKIAPSGEMTVERRYRDLTLNWKRNLPLLGSAHPIYPQATFRSATGDDGSNPMIQEVVLTYIQPPPVGLNGYTGIPAKDGILPPNEFTESATSIEMPIEAHPDFHTFGITSNGALFDKFGKFTGWTAGSRFAGYMTFSVPSVTQSLTTYYWDLPPSVASQVGTILNANWRCASGSTGRKFPHWYQTLNFLYSAVPWNTTVYPGVYGGGSSDSND